MISEALAVVDAPGLLRHVRSAPPLTIRQVIAERDGTCALCLVGSAAGPLPGDGLTLRLEIRPGARATLVASGATIAQGGGPSTLSVDVTVGDGGRLDADPGALIVCAGARVEITVNISLAETATLRWREQVLLGRAGESPGQATLNWAVTRAGRPLLRQRIDLADSALTAWPGMLGPHRTLISELNVGPDVDAHTQVRSAHDVTQKLATNATLTTLLAG